MTTRDLYERLADVLNELEQAGESPTPWSDSRIGVYVVSGSDCQVRYEPDLVLWEVIE